MPVFKRVNNREKRLGEFCTHRCDLFYTVAENCNRCHFSRNTGCSEASCSAIVDRSTEIPMFNHRVPVAFIRLQRRVL